MGGNALKTEKVSRKSFEEYWRITLAVCQKLQPHTVRITVPVCYGSKETFGDSDILVSLAGTKTSREIIEEVFAPNELVSNGECVSFAFQGMQIDIITVPTDKFVFAYTYYSFNDLGNLMGRVAHRMGFKYGHLGLTMPVRYKQTHQLADVLLTLDPEEAFSFLGYDYRGWGDNFNDLEDIFKYICSGKYFNKLLYPLENLNHTNKVRNAKRKTYMEFLQWLQTNLPPDNHNWGVFGDAEDPEAKAARHAHYRGLADKAFPQVQVEKTYKELLENAQIRQEARSRVLTILRGMISSEAEIGKTMSFLRSTMIDYNDITEEYLRDVLKKINTQ